jgi:hypothetical protein
MPKHVGEKQNKSWISKYSAFVGCFFSFDTKTHGEIKVKKNESYIIIYHIDNKPKLFKLFKNLQ